MKPLHYPVTGQGHQGNNNDADYDVVKVDLVRVENEHHLPETSGRTSSARVACRQLGGYDSDPGHAHRKTQTDHYPRKRSGEDYSTQRHPLGGAKNPCCVDQVSIDIMNTRRDVNDHREE